MLRVLLPIMLRGRISTTLVLLAMAEVIPAWPLGHRRWCQLGIAALDDLVQLVTIKSYGTAPRAMVAFHLLAYSHL